MTEKLQKELQDYSSFILKEYGFFIPPTDPVIPALFIIHQEVARNYKSNQLLGTLVQEATKKMNPNIYNFNVPGEALKFQIGSSIKLLFGCLTIVLFLFIGLSWIKIQTEVEKARSIIELSDPIQKELLNRIEKDSEGFYYIEFKESLSPSVINFTEYDEIGRGRVRVYLGRMR
jgi:hypothetical protein